VLELAEQPVLLELVEQVQPQQTVGLVEMAQMLFVVLPLGQIFVQVV